MVGQELYRLLWSIKMSEVMKSYMKRGTSVIGDKAWYRVKDLSEILSMGQSTIWKMVRNKSFPEPVRITARMTVWSSESVMSWVLTKTSGVHEPDNQAVTEAE